MSKTFSRLKRRGGILRRPSMGDKTVDIAELENKTLSELREVARDMGISGYSRLKKEDLVLRLLRAQAEEQGLIFGGGVLDVIDDGIGFLRSDHYLPGPEDVYVSQSQIRRFSLRSGDMVVGQVRPPKENERYYGLLRVEAVNGLDPDTSKARPIFERLTPIFPEEMFDLQTASNILATRMLNIIAPIGRGQRGLIVSPPKAGKTMVLKQIANGITANYTDIHLMVCLIGERPEEVTDMDRSVDAEVISSTFDDPVKSHVRVAEMTLNRAKRLVELGRHVVILLDSITRLSRAYNLVVQPSGRTLSGGLDPAALYPPKHFFGAARNIEDGGSLTIVATCLVDTGSRMDDMIYEEFKGTGNMELHLSRRLAERRVYPAFDIDRSSTRREELLIDPETLAKVWTMRRMLNQLKSPVPTGAGLDSAAALELLLQRMERTSNNQEFLDTLHRDIM
jgi:transcription termination factor Rho